jgi:predicted DNA-binding transcriptional regulator YafY
MKLLQTIFSITWVLGCLGNGFLFIYIEWSILQKNFLQILNPSIHFQVLGLLIANPWFWIFLTMAIVGYFAVSKLENRISKIRQVESTKKDLQKQSESSLSPISLSELNRSPKVDKSNKVQIDLIKNKEKLLQLAIESRQNVEFIYTDKNGEYSERIFAPSSLITMQQTLCVEGYCYLRRSQRTFAIKRMRELRIVSENKLNHNIKAKADSNSQSLSSTNRERNIDNESEQRPYIKLLIDDLETLTNSEWNSVKKLRDIHYELGFRSKKRSQDLRDLISN